MADTLESLEIKVQHNASGADAEINGVATAIGRLKTALTGVPAALKELASAVKAVNDAFKGGTAKYDKFAESMLNVAASAELLGENNNSVSTLANAMNTLSNVKVTSGSFNALAKGVEAVGNATQSITPESIANLDKMVTSLAKLQGVDLQGLGSAMNAVRRGGNITPKEPPTPVPAELQEMISSASAIDVLQAKLVSLRTAMQEAFSAGDADKAFALRGQILQTESALAKAEKAAGTTGRSFREMAKDAAKSNSPLKKIVESLKRIAFYRIIRSVIKDIGQAFQEGLEKAYLFSAGMTGAGHRFAAAMDNIKSAGNAMKAQLGSAFISLYAAVEPILIAIINLVTRVADAISQLLSAFTGITYLKANATAAQFVDTMKAGGAAAKEWKNQLLGFDEINRLEEPSNGGGGGGTNPLKGYEMEDTPIAEKWLKIANAIKSVIAWIKDHLDLVLGVVEAIGVAILGWKLVGFLNGLLGLNLPMSKILGLAIAIGGAFLLVRGVVDAIKNGVNWDNLMEMIGGTLGLTLGLALAFGKVGGAIGLLIGSIAMLVAGVMDWIKTKELSDEAFAAIEIGIAGVAAAIALLTMNWIPLAIGAFVMLGVWAAKNWDKIKAAGEACWRFIKEKAEEYFGPLVNGIKTAFDGIIGIFKGLLDFVTGVFTGNWELAWQGILGIVGGFKKLLTGTVGAIKGILNAIIAPLQDIVGWAEAALDRLAALFGVDMSRLNDPNYNVYEDPTMWTSNFASGGFPDEGQMFVAREAGPEMVGTIGGRTAVANNDDIVESIRAGVYEAVMAGMGNGGGNNDVNLKVYLDSREIRAGLQRLDRAWGA